MKKQHVVGTYTTHAFRRGGAQHRFFVARKKWPLSWIRIWGGWSKTERMNTLINYILDDLAQKEDYAGDFCSPFRRDHNLSILDQEPEPFNSEEDRLSILCNRFNTVESELEKLSGLLSDILELNRTQQHDQPGEIVIPAQIGLPNLKNGWKEAVKWYEEGLEGYFGPLKSVSKAERKALIDKYNGMSFRFTNYKVIYDEFVSHFERNVELFEAQYQETGLTMTPLYKAIRANKKERSSYLLVIVIALDDLNPTTTTHIDPIHCTLIQT